MSVLSGTGTDIDTAAMLEDATAVAMETIFWALAAIAAALSAASAASLADGVSRVSGGRMLGSKLGLNRMPPARDWQSINPSDLADVTQ